ncbi:hypothetical protein P691DRAFT_257502 [Macrolepiota fuliginosa MF-IS2]|uniref:Uncharacterized protein n=1 Tax=Macrolepiota fuliginosa MF-IS2 TaxID=1400762 RepID=A0A9P5XIS4_9AGAR|nr:hypothetical protein P691DRAFT_257502 [Macrolepiota fuliginosa MF-IS2]
MDSAYLTVSSCVTVPSALTFNAKGSASGGASSSSCSSTVTTSSSTSGAPGPSSNDRFCPAIGSSSVSSGRRTRPNSSTSISSLGAVVLLGATGAGASFTGTSARAATGFAGSCAAIWVEAETVAATGFAGSEEALGFTGWRPESSALSTSAALIFAIRIARRLATTSRLDPASAWAARGAIEIDSAVAAAPRPMESALAAKS